MVQIKGKKLTFPTSYQFAFRGSNLKRAILPLPPFVDVRNTSSVWSSLGKRCRCCIYTIGKCWWKGMVILTIVAFGRGA